MAAPISGSNQRGSASRDYRAFLEAHQSSIEAFKRRQQAAFEEERERWALLPPAPEPDLAAPNADDPGAITLSPGELPVRADLTSNVWQVAIEPGAEVAAGDRLLILESMKMEIPVPAPSAGQVSRILVKPGAMVTAGQIIATIRPRAP